MRTLRSEFSRTGIAKEAVLIGWYEMNKAMFHRWVNPETILLATNLRDAAHLVPHAIAQAKSSGARVLLVHVVEPLELRATWVQGQPSLLPGPALRSAQEQLNQIARQFQWQGLLSEPMAFRGSPSEQIEAVIAHRGVDRILMGTRSADALERQLLGSVADDLLHSIDVPICIIGPHVRPQIQPDQQPASILYATSFHHDSQVSAQFAYELAMLHKSRLTYLHVIAQGHANHRQSSQLFSKERDALLNLSKGHALLIPQVAVVREGNPAEEILGESRRLLVDLIVLGATGASKVSRLLATGVVHQVIAESAAPVITLRHTWVTDAGD